MSFDLLLRFGIPISAIVALILQMIRIEGNSFVIGLGGGSGALTLSMRDVSSRFAHPSSGSFLRPSRGFGTGPIR